LSFQKSTTFSVESSVLTESKPDTMIEATTGTTKSSPDRGA
jgi:hypothetical protein